MIVLDKKKSKTLQKNVCEYTQTMCSEHSQESHGGGNYSEINLTGHKLVNISANYHSRKSNPNL